MSSCSCPVAAWSVGSAADGDLKATVLAALLPGEWSVYDLSAPQVPTTS